MSDVMHYKPLTLCRKGAIDWQTAGWTTSEYLVTCPDCLAALQPWQPIETAPQEHDADVILTDGKWCAWAWWDGEEQQWIITAMVTFDGVSQDEWPLSRDEGAFKPTHWRRPLTPPLATKEKS